MSVYYSDDVVTLHHGDALDVLRTLPDASVDCCITSPPYFGLRDYGVAGQLGLEESPAEYIARLVAVLAEVRRVLASDGTCWLNLGDSFAAHQRGSDEGWDKSRRSNPARGRGARMKTITRAICRTCGTDEPSTPAAADKWAEKHLREHPDHDVRTPTRPANAIHLGAGSSAAQDVQTRAEEKAR